MVAVPATKGEGVGGEIMSCLPCPATFRIDSRQVEGTRTRAVLGGVLALSDRRSMGWMHRGEHNAYIISAHAPYRRTSPDMSEHQAPRTSNPYNDRLVLPVVVEGSSGFPLTFAAPGPGIVCQIDPPHVPQLSTIPAADWPMW